MAARLLLMTACVCLMVAGCSSSSPPAAPAAAKTPAAHDHADHGHDHDEHEHDHPESFAAGVAQLQATVAAVKDHLAVGATDAADEAVHSLGHLIEDVQGFVAKEKLGEQSKAAATKALDELFECFDTLDTALHAPEGKGKPPAEVHASLAERIDGAIKTLQGTLAQ
ncbi:MAG: hypothetical protein WCC69_00105 [Pirellulales bacterium]